MDMSLVTVMQGGNVEAATVVVLQWLIYTDPGAPDGNSVRQGGAIASFLTPRYSILKRAWDGKSRQKPCRPDKIRAIRCNVACNV